MLSLTTERVLIVDDLDYKWYFDTDATETPNLLGIILNLSNEVNISRKCSDMDMQFALKDKTVTDEFYYILQEITDEFSKEEWQDLINEAYKNGEVLMEIGEMKLRVHLLNCKLYMTIFTYKEFE